MQAAQQPGVSMAAVAMAHGINANLLRRRVAHARRKFVELHLTNKSILAATAIEFIGQLYGIEREVKGLAAEDRLRERRTRAAPVAQALHRWLLEYRPKVPDGSATAKAMEYSLNRWAALTRYLGDLALPIDNNFDEQQIRPWATGRKNWLFAGTLLAGQRAAAIMSLIQTAKLNGHDPYAYLRDVLTRLPTQRERDIADLLSHRWMQARDVGILPISSAEAGGTHPT